MKIIVRIIAAAILSFVSLATIAETEWHPKVPLRSDGAPTYCAVWASQVLVGVDAYVRASTEERDRALIISYQTRAYHNEHEEASRSADLGDGSHAQIQVITDGYDKSGHWILDEDVKRWVEDVFFFGWKWAGENPAEEHAGDGPDWWLKTMHTVCMNDAEL